MPCWALVVSSSKMTRYSPVPPEKSNKICPLEVRLPPVRSASLQLGTTIVELYTSAEGWLIVSIIVFWHPLESVRTELYIPDAKSTTESTTIWELKLMVYGGLVLV